MTGPQPAATPRPAAPRPSAPAAPKPSSPAPSAPKSTTPAPSDLSPVGRSPNGPGNAPFPNGPVTNNSNRPEGPAPSTVNIGNKTPTPAPSTSSPSPSAPSPGRDQAAPAPAPATNRTDSPKTAGQDTLAAENRARVQREQVVREQTQKLTTQNLQRATTGAVSTSTPAPAPTPSSAPSPSPSPSVSEETEGRAEGSSSKGNRVEDGQGDDGNDGSPNDGNRDSNGQQIAKLSSTDDPNGDRKAGELGDKGLKRLTDQSPAKDPTDPNANKTPTDQSPAKDPVDPNVGKTPTDQSPAKDPVDPNAGKTPTDPNPAKTTTEPPEQSAARLKAAETRAKDLGITLPANVTPDQAEKTVEAELSRMSSPEGKAPSGDETRSKVTNRINALSILPVENVGPEGSTPTNFDQKQVNADLAAGIIKEIPTAGTNRQFDVAVVLGVQNPLKLGTAGPADATELAKANQTAVARLNGVSEADLKDKSTADIAAINRQKSVDYLKGQGVTLPENATYSDVLKGYVDVYNKTYNANLPANATWSQVMEVWKQQNAGNTIVQQRAQAAGLTMNLAAADYEKYFRTVSGLEGYQIPVKQTPQGPAPVTPESPRMDPNGTPPPLTGRTSPPEVSRLADAVLDPMRYRSELEKAAQASNPQQAIDDLLKSKGAYDVLPALKDVSPEVLQQQLRDEVLRKLQSQTDVRPPEDSSQNTTLQANTRRDLDTLFGVYGNLESQLKNAANSTNPEADVKAVLDRTVLPPDMDPKALQEEILRRYRPVQDPERSILRTLPRIETVNINPFDGFNFIS